MPQSVGAVALDIVAGKNTVDSAIKGAMNDAQNTASKGASGISNALGKVGSVAKTVGKVTAVGLGVASTAVVALGKSAIGAYANYEQLVGGVETLFKDSADTVIKNASRAYKTAGLSANDYMETVTSFSASLLQSLGGDTVKASEMADMAITDMSDNANKMGTSMEMIQNAYNGFAKQNFTMLDNLKLGYGGTKEEMQRLLADAEKLSGIHYDISSFSDITEAIHVIQTELDITGTTAKEASSTISGSLSMVKSSWTNLVTGMTSDSADFGTLIDEFVNSVSTAGENLIPRVSKILDGVANLITQLAPKIIEKIPDMMSTLLPSVVNGAVALVNAIVGAMPQLIQLIINTLPQFISGIQNIFEGIVSALPELLQSICLALPTLIPILIEALVSMITTLASNFSSIIQPIIDNLPKIITSIVSALIDNLPALIEGCIQLTIALVGAMPQIIMALIEAIPQIVMSIAEGLIASAPILINSIGQIVMGIVDGFWTIIEPFASAIGDFFSGVLETISGFLGGIKETWSAVWNSICEFVAPIWETIKNIVKVGIMFIAEFFHTAFDLITLPFRLIWENCKDTIISVWNAITGAVTTAVNTVRDTITNVWNSIVGFITPVLNGIKDTFTNVWNAISGTVSGVVNTVKDTISNGFNKAKDIVTGIFDTIGNKISDVMNGAKNIVSGAIEKIKGFFNFDWHLPKLKLPHFSIEGEFSLTPPSVPHFSIDWYAKAMDKGMILNSPTIFGASGGNLLGAGEAGSETVVGTNSLLNMIKFAVSSSMLPVRMGVEAPALNNVRTGSTDNSKMDQLIELILELLDKDDDKTFPIYIGNELIDEYILNKNSRAVLRSGGYA